MKRLTVKFDRIEDTTGYLFSFVKCLSAALRYGGYEAYAEDVIAASGFAFRMWVNEAELCPSAMSIWEFRKQKEWVENVGLTCAYTERLWGQDAYKEERRIAAIEQIKDSIDRGIAAIGWDLSGGEWGLVIGYDDKTEQLAVLRIDDTEVLLPYDRLGELDIPILSVLTVKGENSKTAEQLVADTKNLARSHLMGEEWCENVQGLAAYDALTRFVLEKADAGTVWNLEYYLGTYAAMKWYAWKFFEKYRQDALAAFYQRVYQGWKDAFDAATSGDITDPQVRSAVVTALALANTAEIQALESMK